VPRLYRTARRGSSYEGSLALLAAAAARRDAALPSMRVKSSVMLGLGEQDEEVLAVMADLRQARVDVLTLGQYLQPTLEHLPVERVLDPSEFERYRVLGMELGFLHVESGPLVRSSYHAERHGPALLTVGGS
jgi:lipoic acid synthetase